MHGKAWQRLSPAGGLQEQTDDIAALVMGTILSFCSGSTESANRNAECPKKV